MRRNANLRLLSEGALGCIVELYQFHCTNESLPLRLLSGYGQMPMCAL